MTHTDSTAPTLETVLSETLAKRGVPTTRFYWSRTHALLATDRDGATILICEPELTDWEDMTPEEFDGVLLLRYPQGYGPTTCDVYGTGEREITLDGTDLSAVVEQIRGEVATTYGDFTPPEIDPFECPTTCPDCGYAEFDYTPCGATVTFTSAGVLRQGVVGDFTERSMMVHCDDGTRARLTRSRWQERRVLLGDRAHRARREAKERLGYGATPAQERHPQVRDVVSDLASIGGALASVPAHWEKEPGVDGLIAQWLPAATAAPYPGRVLVRLVADGADRLHEHAARIELRRIRDSLRSRGWYVNTSVAGGALINLALSTRF